MHPTRPLQSVDAGPGLPGAEIRQTANRRTGLVGLVLVVAIVGVLGPIGQHDFVGWDDDVHVYTNPRFHPVTLSNLLAFWQTPYEHLYIPMTYTVWGGVAWLQQTWSSGPLQAGPFHWLNLIVHIGSVLLVYRLGLHLLTPYGKAESRCAAAAAGALLFGLHPLQVEAVAWVSGLKDVLSGFWSLLALWQYVAYAGTPHVSHRRMRYAAATLALILALLSKPSAMVVPIMAWSIVIIGLRPAWRPATLALIPWLGVSVLGGLLTKWQQPDAVLPYVTPWGQRPLIALDSLGFYLGKLLWPVRLGVDYGRTPQFVLEQGWGFGLAVVPLILGGLIWWAHTPPRRGVRLGTGLFVAGLLPVLGLVPFMFQAYSTVADRYVYVALLGPALGLSWTVIHSRHQAGAWALAGIVVVGLAVRSVDQVPVWQDTVSLFTQALRINPRSVPAHNNLGLALAQQGKFPEAVAHYERALQLKPNSAYSHNNLGLVLARQGKLSAAAAHYQAAIRLHPRYVNAHQNLGLTLVRQGRFEQAIGVLRRALETSPNQAELHNDLGIALAAQGDVPAAVQAFARAIQLQPDHANAYHNLGLAWSRQGRFRDAIVALRIALRLRPAWPQAGANLARLLVTQPHPTVSDLHAAVSLAEAACRATDYQDADALYALAMAYSAVGQKPKARDFRQRALRQARFQDNSGLVAQIRSQLPLDAQEAGFDALP